MELPIDVLLLEREKRKRRERASQPKDFHGDDPVGWIEKEFYIEELHGPIKLVPYQRACLREALRRDQDGLFVYDLVLWGDIKKSAKSTIAAAVILWRAFHTPYGKFRIVANDQKQAMSRVFGFIEVCLRLNKSLGDRSVTSRLTIRLDTGSTIEAVAVDPKGEAGGGDEMVEFTELHAANSNAAEQMWAETALSPLKYGYSQRWIDTYAGHTGEAIVLEPLYTALIVDGQRITKSDFPDGKGSYPNGGPRENEGVYVNGRLFAMWNTGARCPWQTPGYYTSEKAQHTPAEYDRIHLNQWVSSVQQFVPIEWWDACKVNELPVNRHNEVVIALDAGVSDDCFGMIAVSRHGNKIAVRYARKWTPPKNGKLEFKNQLDPNDINYPMGELRRLCRELNVICITYDPSQLEYFASECVAAGLGLIEPFNQNQPRLVADKRLYDSIRERTVIHRGEPDLREHIMNANSTAEDKQTLRIVKRSQSLKIDLAVSLSMAHEMAFVYLPE